MWGAEGAPPRERMKDSRKHTHVTRRSSNRVSLNENFKTKNIIKCIFFIFLISFRLTLFEERRFDNDDFSERNIFSVMISRWQFSQKYFDEWWNFSFISQMCKFLKPQGWVLGFIWEACLFHLLLLVPHKWRASYGTDWAETFTEVSLVPVTFKKDSSSKVFKKI